MRIEANAARIQRSRLEEAHEGRPVEERPVEERPVEETPEETPPVEEPGDTYAPPPEQVEAKSREDVVNELWGMARVPRHAIEKMNDAELAATYDRVAGAIASGPGKKELEVGKHKLKITVDASGRVTESECKKQSGFLNALKKVGKVALTVASFVPGPVGIAARIAQGAIAAYSAAKNKNWMGAIGAAASAFGAGAAEFGGAALAGASRVANGAAQAIRGIQCVQRGGIAGVLGGVAGLAAGGLEAVGEGASRAAEKLQDAANRIQPLASVEAMHAAGRAADRAEADLRDARASGDARAIADAERALEQARRNQRSSVLGVFGAGATLGASFAGDNQIGAPRTRTEVGLDAAARGFDLARGVNDGDLISAGAAAFGAAAGLARGTQAPRMIETENGRRERFDPLQTASRLVDAANGFRLADGAARAASRAVEDAQRALDAAHRANDTGAIRRAREELQRARLGASDAELARYFAQDAAAAGVHNAYRSHQETRRADQHTREQHAMRTAAASSLKAHADRAGEALAAVLEDERAQGGFRTLGEEALAAIADQKLALDAAVESGDPRAIQRAADALEEARVFAEQRAKLLREVLRPAELALPPLAMLPSLPELDGVPAPAPVASTPAEWLKRDPHTMSNTPGGNYVVQGGETLTALSRRYGVSIADLRRLNPQLGADGWIFRGQTLNVPQVDLPDPFVLRADATARLAGQPGAQFTVPPAEHQWISGRLDLSQIDENGVRQGGIGDCYMLAAFASIARANPQVIRDAITDNRDGTYTVRLYEGTGFHAREVRVTVDAQQPVREGWGTRAYAAGGMQEWAPILEKALATRAGGYEQIVGGSASTVFSMMTGQPYRPTHVPSIPDHVLWDRLVTDLDARSPLAAGTSDDANLYRGTNLVANHAYSVIGARYQNGRRVVELRNPWGGTAPGAGVFTLPFEDFRRFYPWLHGYSNAVDMR